MKWSLGAAVLLTFKRVNSAVLQWNFFESFPSFLPQLGFRNFWCDVEKLMLLLNENLELPKYMKTHVG